MRALTNARGCDQVRRLNRDDLVALPPEAAEITRLPYAPEVREREAGLLGKVG